MGLQAVLFSSFACRRISHKYVSERPGMYLRVSCSHDLRLGGWILHVLHWIASTLDSWKGVGVAQVSLGETHCGCER